LKLSSFKILSIVILAFVLFVGISGNTVVSQEDNNNKISAAEIAAESVLGRIDAGDYLIDEDYSATFKGLVTTDQWQKQLTAVRVPLGDVLSRRAQDKGYYASLPGVPDGHYVVFIFATEFVNKKSALETVTMTLEGDLNEDWKLTGYYIK